MPFRCFKNSIEFNLNSFLTPVAFFYCVKDVSLSRLLRIFAAEFFTISQMLRESSCLMYFWLDSFLGLSDRGDFDWINCIIV